MIALPSTPKTQKEAADAAASTLPFSCITGVSKEVLRHIQQGALSAKAKYFLTMIAIDSFGNAGWQKQQGVPAPGLSCRFALSAWASEHGWSRQYAWRIREQMMALGILHYAPDSADPQQGTLTWNVNFDEWVVLDDTYRRQRSARPGSGRPRLEAPGQVGGSVQRKSNVLQKSNVLRPEFGREAPVQGRQVSEKSNVLQPKGESKRRQAQARAGAALSCVLVQEKSNVLQAVRKSNVLQGGRKSNGLQPASGQIIKRVTGQETQARSQAVPAVLGRKDVGKKERDTEPPDVGSEASTASTSGAEQGDSSSHQDRLLPVSHRAAASSVAAEQPVPPPLQVASEKLASWQEDVQEQRRLVAQAQREYERACAELERSPVGGHHWGELRRHQRFLQRHLEDEQQKLAQFELFVRLIEQGCSKDEACEQIYSQGLCPAEPEAAAEADSASAPQVEPTLLAASAQEQTPAPELSPKTWRAALFTGLLALFDWEPKHLNKNTRGLANKAAMLLQESGIRPEQLPRLKQLFERAYPKVTHYTPIALANHATELAALL